MNRFLIIQTAFIGDVILATSVIEALHNEYPNASIDFLLRKGNEGLLQGHPYLSEVIIWDKKSGKYSQLGKTIRYIRSKKYDVAINLQRFFTTGAILVLSGASLTIGFSKNPLSWLFAKRYPHIIDQHNNITHEVDRNLSLVQHMVKNPHRILPKLYPSEQDFIKVKTDVPYVTISPTSVWFTKQYPMERWVQVLNLIPPSTKIFLLGGKPDTAACEEIKNKASHPNTEVLAGKLSFLESAALMKGSMMNYVNDSAPMHLASAMDAPVTAIFCSTVPAFGFGPLSSNSKIIETSENLICRPCGLHGYKQCPESHFKCAAIEALKITETTFPQTTYP